MDITIDVEDPSEDVVEGMMSKQGYVEAEQTGQRLYPSDVIEDFDEYYCDEVFIDVNDTGDEMLTVLYKEFLSWPDKEQQLLQMVKDSGYWDEEPILTIKATNRRPYWGA